MSVESNKAIVARFYEESVSAGDIELIEDLASEEMTDHAALAMGWGSGRKGFQTHVEEVRRMLPDFRAEVTELIGEDDVVVAYWTASGTAVAAFLGVEPTGRPFTAEAISRLRFQDGRIVEYQVLPGPIDASTVHS
jgi:predicted ester cyclase